MPVAAVRVKQLSRFVIHDAAIFTTPPFRHPRSPNAQPRGARPATVFKF
jgi:hypothetical protein